MQFVFETPTRLIFGPGKLDALRTEKLPGKKALLLTSRGGSVVRSGALARVTAALDAQKIEWVHLAIVEPNPLSTTVMTGANRAREDGCAFVIGLGGGSVMDCAKAIALCTTNDGDIWDYVQQGQGGRKQITATPIPIVAITTTAGTGSEVDAGGVITNPVTQEKCGIGHPTLLPKIAIVDPELMLSVPPMLTAYQGFDALFHAIEGYVTKRPNYLSEMYALASVRHCAEGLARAVRDGSDYEAREHMAIANTLSGYVMVCGRLTSQHSMEHALSAFHQDLPHGAGLIMLSLAYFGHMIKTGARSDRFVELARALGVRDAVHPADFLRALHDLQVACGADNLRMSDYGVTREEIPALAEKARSAGGMLFEQDPVALTFEDTVAIFEAAYR